MTENVCNLLDNLTKHNSRCYGYELSQSEILQILKLFDDVKRLEEFEAIGTIEEFEDLKEIMSHLLTRHLHQTIELYGREECVDDLELILTSYGISSEVLDGFRT